MGLGSLSPVVFYRLRADCQSDTRSGYQNSWQAAGLQEAHKSLPLADDDVLV